MSKDEAYLLEKIYYSLSHTLEQTLSLSPDLSEGLLEFHLNQESLRMHYLHNRLTDEFLFMEEEEKEAISNGLLIKR
ncbi:MAG: hypothetical protein ACOYU0_02865 [Nitrospirota bacterium]